MKTQNVTIEQLAEKLNQSVWVKGDLKRIYLNDEGYNTKKMSTKTFIFEKDGEFIVSCRIECPSQNYNWIKSQEEEVKEGVYSKIENIIEKEISESVFVITRGDLFVNCIGDAVTIDKIDDSDVYYNSEKAKRFITENNYNGEVSEFNKELFTEIQNNWIKNNPIIEVESKKPQTIVTVVAENKPKEAILPTPLSEYTIGAKYNHSSFGEVTATSEDENTITVEFGGKSKKLLKKFAHLTKV